MPGVIIDIGTGDGEFVYTIAKENPDRFVIGIEPNHKGLERISARVYKKPVKGGIENALFVLGSIEELPQELNEIANQVFINFPWAGLLKGLLLVKKTTWLPIKRICQNGAFIDILFSYEKSREENEFNKLELPDIDVSYLQKVTAPKLDENGLKVLEIREFDAGEIRKYPSSWAKKLSFGRDRKYFYMRLKFI
jgi:16S rRNA (adenine(1408)-N(1))-methyltransferase